MSPATATQISDVTRAKLVRARAASSKLAQLSSHEKNALLAAMAHALASAEAEILGDARAAGGAVSHGPSLRCLQAPDRASGAVPGFPLNDGYHLPIVRMDTPVDPSGTVEMTVWK